MEKPEEILKEEKEKKEKERLKTRKRQKSVVKIKGMENQ